MGRIITGKDLVLAFGHVALVVFIGGTTNKIVRHVSFLGIINSIINLGIGCIGFAFDGDGVGIHDNITRTGTRAEAGEGLLNVSLGDDDAFLLGAPIVGCLEFRSSSINGLSRQWDDLELCGAGDGVDDDAVADKIDLLACFC